MVEVLLFFDDYISRMAPGSLRKMVLDYKADERLVKRFASERCKKRIYNYVFSKVNNLRKRREGTSVVRSSGFWKGQGKSEVRGLDTGRSSSKVEKAERNSKINLVTPYLFLCHLLVPYSLTLCAPAKGYFLQLCRPTNSCPR